MEIWLLGQGKIPMEEMYPPWNYNSPWKRMVENGWLEDEISFRDGLVSGATLVLGRVNLWLDGHAHRNSLLRWQQKAAMDKGVHQQLLDWYITVVVDGDMSLSLQCPMKLGVIQSRCSKSLAYYGQLLLLLCNIQVGCKNPWEYWQF